MRVIILCESSGTVRDAFIKRGHDAWSCDLKMNFTGPHLKVDARTLDYSLYDLAICHPPCTYLAISGAHLFSDPVRIPKQREAIDFFMFCANLPVAMVAIENPVCIMSSEWRKPDQIIQPYQFGHNASKKTCLWLKNLPFLAYTKILKREQYGNQTASGQNKVAPSSTRSADRARTYEGVAEAMADQWGSLPTTFRTSLF